MNETQWGDSNKYPKCMFFEEITRPFLHISLLIKYSVQQQIHFNGNIFGNICRSCNEDSLYMLLGARLVKIFCYTEN